MTKESEPASAHKAEEPMPKIELDLPHWNCYGDAGHVCEAPEPADKAGASAEEAVRAARGALRCLYLAVEQPVATDVEKHIEAAFTALRAADDDWTKIQKGIEEQADARVAASQERVKRLEEALVDAAAADLTPEFKEKAKDLHPIDAAQLGYAIAIMLWQKALAAGGEEGKP